MSNVPGLNLPKGVTLQNLRNWSSLNHKANFYRPSGNPVKDFLEQRGGKRYEDVVKNRNALLRKLNKTNANMANLRSKLIRARNAAILAARQAAAKRSPNRSVKRRSPKRSPKRRNFHGFLRPGEAGGINII